MDLLTTSSTTASATSYSTIICIPGVVHHDITITELSTAVYVCIAVAILLIVMAVVLSVVMVMLCYKQRRLRSLKKSTTMSRSTRRDSDEIWSVSV